MCAAQLNWYQRVRDCLSKEYAMVCLKEEALKTLDEAVTSNEAVTLFNTIDIVKDPTFQLNTTDEGLPENVTMRDAKLNSLLSRKFDDFINSRTIKLNLNSVVEGKNLQVLH